MPLSIIALAAVLVMMLGELWLSRSNERWMLARGAVIVTDPAYRLMPLAYPGAFVAMAIEGAIVNRPVDAIALAGVLVLIAAKALKFWAIASLGKRWTYRVLVMPGAPLVTGGPYRVFRHPNYVGVVGELVAMALIAGARVTGPLGVLVFGWLLMVRIRTEEQALGFTAVAKAMTDPPER
jgi:methyltransferase